MPDQSLSLEEKERIIAEKVAAFKWPSGRVKKILDLIAGGVEKVDHIKL